MEERFGGMMDAVLSGHGIMLHPQHRPTLLTLVADALDDAATTNLRKAESDYSPDTAAAKYPKLETEPRAVHVPAELGSPSQSFSIELHYLNMMQGHSDGHASTGYGETTIKTLAREIQNIPAIRLD